MTALTATLSADSLSRLEAQVMEYARGLETACDVIAQSVAQEAAGTAKAACPQATGTLAGSIRVEPRGDGMADVLAESDHAAFVEFGTGITGARNPSGHAKDAAVIASGAYTPDGMGHGDSGWWYPGDDGELHWTKGQSGKGFMAAGAEEARSRVHEIARRAVRR